VLRCDSICNDARGPVDDSLFSINVVSWISPGSTFCENVGTCVSLVDRSMVEERGAKLSADAALANRDRRLRFGCEGTCVSYLSQKL